MIATTVTKGVLNKARRVSFRLIISDITKSDEEKFTNNAGKLKARGQHLRSVQGIGPGLLPALHGPALWLVIRVSSLFGPLWPPIRKGVPIIPILFTCLWRIAKKMDSADYEFEWDREFPQLRVSMEQILPTSAQGASFMRVYRWNGPEAEIFQHNGKRDFLRFQAASGV